MSLTRRWLFWMYKVNMFFDLLRGSESLFSMAHKDGLNRPCFTSLVSLTFVSFPFPSYGPRLLVAIWSVAFVLLCFQHYSKGVKYLQNNVRPSQGCGHDIDLKGGSLQIRQYNFLFHLQFFLTFCCNSDYLFPWMKFKFFFL